MLYVFTEKKHYQKDSMNMIITMNYRTSPRSGLFETRSYNKTQLPNDQIRST